MDDIRALSDDELADEITTWAGRIAAAQARLLDLVAELDRRGLWFGPGLLSTAHWLSWRLGMGLTAAHERVRVARALGELPLTSEAFHGGRLSWTQVRAMTRVATPADEATYLECARHATGAQLEKLVRGVRRAQKLIEDAADPERAAWQLRTRLAYDDDGTLVLSIRMPAERGPAVIAALEEAMADLDRQRTAASTTHDVEPASAQPSSAEDGASASPSLDAGVTDPDTTPVPRATHAEGLLHLCQSYLGAIAEAQPARHRRGRARLRVHIDPLSGWSRLHDGELLPPGACTAPTGGGIPNPADSELRPLVAADLNRHDLGRTRHDPSPALRELLGIIDGERCRFSGCTRGRRLHAHHVTPWAKEGSTDLANLVLLCARHHALVHAEGFQLVLLPDRRLRIATADGTAVPHRPTLPFQPAKDVLDALQFGPPIIAGTLPPHTSGDRLDLHYAVAVLVQQAA